MNDSLGILTKVESKKPVGYRDSLGLLNLKTEMEPKAGLKDSLGILSGPVEQPEPTKQPTDNRQEYFDMANQIGAPIPENVNSLNKTDLTTMGKGAAEGLGRSALQVLGAPGRVAADIAKVFPYAQMGVGKYVEKLDPYGTKGQAIIENAQEQLSNLNKIKANLTFVDEGLTDTALSFALGGGAGAGVRALLERPDTMAKLARMSGITESLLTTGVKSGLVAAAGDKFIIDPALTVIQKKVGESNLPDSTKELILMTSPLILGLISGASIEFKLDKMLKNPLAVGLFNDLAKQGASPEDAAGLIQKIADDGKLPEVFDQLKPESLVKNAEPVKPIAAQQPKTVRPIQTPSPEVKPEISQMMKPQKGYNDSLNILAKPKESQVRTLRGRIKQMGGINFLNFKGELSDMPTAVKFLSKKTGTPIDLAEQQLRDEGWIRQDENLLDIFRDKEILRRGRQDQIESFSKPAREMTESEKRLKKEMEWEPEEPPPGDYGFVKARNLPDGKTVTIIDNQGPTGWDLYKVKKEKDGIYLEDGTTYKVGPDTELQVLKEDLSGGEVGKRMIKNSTLYAHPATVTGPVGAISAGVDWDEYEKTGEIHIEPKRMFIGALAGAALGAGYRPAREILRKAATSWDKSVSEKLLDPLKSKVNGLIVNEDLRHALGMNRSEKFKELFRNYHRDVERAWNKAAEIGKAIQEAAPTKLEQKRLMQVIKGSVTSNKKTYEAGQKINKMFADYRKLLEEADLLHYSRFDELTRKERAKLRNIIAKDKSDRAMYEEEFLKAYDITPDNKIDTRLSEYKLGGDNSNMPDYAKEEIPVEAYSNTAQKTSAEWARSKLHDHYHFGSAKEYAPIFYKAKEGLTPKEREILQDEIKRLKIKSRRGNPEGNQALESMIAKMEDMLGTGWKARRAMKITRQELNKRYSHRRLEIPDEVQRIMGRIDEAAFPIAKMAGVQSSDVIKGRLFKEIANNSNWAVPKQAFQYEVPKNWVKVSDDRFGALDGMFVRKDVWEDLKEVEEWRGAFVRNWDKMMGAWKYGKVVLNPATHARNFMSNVILAYMGDVNPGDVKTYTKAARAFMKGEDNAFYKEAADWGLFNNTFVSSEITKLRDNLDALQDGKQLKAWIKKAFEKPALLYEGNEKLFKMSVFIKARESGLSVDAAARKAEKFLFNYSDIPPWVKHFKRWGAPFFTFTYKAVPMFAEMAIRKPWKVGALMAAMYGLEEFSKQKLGMSDEKAKEERNLLPAWQQRKILGVGPYSQILMPFNDKWGNHLYLDTAYILPYGNLGEKWGQSALPLSDLLPSNPIFQLGAELLTNKESFTGRPIYNELIDSQAKVAQKYLELAWREAVPSLAPGGYGFNKLKTGVKNSLFGGEEKDWADRPIELQTAILSSLFGIKLSPANMKKLKQYEVGQINRIKSAFRSERADLARQYKRNAISKKDYMEQVRELADLEREIIKKRMAK